MDHRADHAGRVLADRPFGCLSSRLLCDQLTRRELLYISALTTIGIATHFSHVPIALGLILLGAVIRPIFAPVQVGLRQWAALLLLPLVIAICAMLAVNWINSGEISFARNSNVFLLAKLIDEGPAFSYLAQACPQVNYALCAHLENLRGLTHDDLKWGGQPVSKSRRF